MALQELGSEDLRILGDFGVPDRIVEQPRLVGGEDVLGRGRHGPVGGKLGGAKQALGLLAQLHRHDQGADALAARAAGAARAVQQRLGVRGQLGVDHQFEVGQVDAARGHVGRHADPGPAVAHRLKRVGPLVLGQLARERHDRKAPVRQPRGEARHGGAGVGEDDGVGGVLMTQRVDDRRLLVALGHLQRLVGDVGVLAALGGDDDALGVGLEILGQLGDGGRHRGREQERAAALGTGREDEFEVLAEAQIEHLVGLVEHDGADVRQIDRAAADVIGEAAGRGDDEMRAPVERAALVADFHAADGGGELGAGAAIEPFQLAHHLARQFAGRRDGQRQRGGGAAELAVIVEDGRADGEAEAHGLAGAGLRRDQQVALGKLGRGDGLLHGGERVVAARVERVPEGLHHM
ncbi:hypothetical protein MBELCI_2050 [Limimaricola cinnabarinus LL-001]|uniref:Uncharacterized protein n=1 Tax=Limimaricola cinnabarinus LL-001 TaxID=1337093 RepID=U3AMN3_9RHOB|nr:hypothetical protein MBELCI_2050 [Limimaricola cinnabarinus LL-001]